MARYLALDLDQKQVRLVSLSTARGGPRIEEALTYTFAEDLTPSSGEGLGKILREHLKQNGVGPFPLLACVGRDRLIFKEVRFPAVPDHEEPALVRFQASKELTEPASEVVIDYLILSEKKAPGPRRAMAMVLRREVVRSLEALTRGMGVKLVGVVPRPLAVAGALARGEGPKPAHEPVAVLNAGDRWAELSIIKDGLPWFSRSLPVGPALMQDVRRSLMLYSTQEGEESLPQELFLGGRQTPEHLESWRGGVGLKVHGLDPFRPGDKEVPTEERGNYLGAAGLAQLAGTALPVNFLRPHEGGPSPGAVGQRQLMVIGVAVGVGMLLLLLLGLFFVSFRRADLEDLRADEKKLDERIKGMNLDKPTVDALKDWEAGTLSWVDELYDISASFPYEEGLKINHLLATTVVRKTPGDKFTGRIKLEGVAPAAKAELVDEFIKTMRASPRGDGKSKVKEELVRVTPESQNTVEGVQKFHLTIDVARQRAPDFHAVLVPPKKAPSKGKAVEEMAPEEPEGDGEVIP